MPIAWWAPTGTELDDTEAWQPLGWIDDDGLAVVLGELHDQPVRLVTTETRTLAVALDDPAKVDVQAWLEQRAAERELEQAEQ
jgi:hypothetical protein